MEKDFLPLFAMPKSREELNLLSPAVLAFVGDGVQTLFVRTEVSLTGNLKPHEFHNRTAHIINAASQASAARKILCLLSEEEMDIYKRCRNFKTGTTAKNASLIDYKTATGLEGLIGYLYLAGRNERLTELLHKAYKE